MTWLQFLPQVRHVDVHGAGLTVEVEAPRLLKNLLAAEDESAVFGEGEEQIEFLCAQAQRGRIDSDLPSGWVNRQVAESNRGGVFAPVDAIPAPQNRFDARNEFARVEWLGQVIVRAEFETEDLVDIFVAGGEHENRGGVIRGAQSAADFETVELRQHHIQHDQGGMFAVRQIERGFAVLRSEDAKTFAFEVHARELDDGGFVVYEEDEFVQGLNVLTTKGTKCTKKNLCRVMLSRLRRSISTTLCQRPFDRKRTLPQGDTP